MRSSLQSSGSADVLIVDTLRLSLHGCDLSDQNCIRFWLPQ